MQMIWWFLAISLSFLPTTEAAIPLIPLKTLCTACWVYGEAEIKG